MADLPDLMREHADYMDSVTDFIGSPDAIARALRDGADEIEQLRAGVFTLYWEPDTSFIDLPQAAETVIGGTEIKLVGTSLKEVNPDDV